MSSPPMVGLEHEIEAEFGELLRESAAQEPAASRRTSRAQLGKTAPRLRKGPVLLAPEILKGRPFLQIDYFDFDQIKSASNFPAMKNLVASLDPQSVLESRAAFNRIKSCWVKFNSASDILSNDYLRRRNLTLILWKTGHKSDTASPAFVSCCPPAARGLYLYTDTVTRTINDKDFAWQLLAIRLDASVPTKYRPNWDKPQPCP